MKKRIIINIDEKWESKLNTMENTYGLDKGQIIEIALKRSIPKIEDGLKDLIPVDVQDKFIKSEDMQKDGSLTDQTEKSILEIEDSLRVPVSVSEKVSEPNISYSKPNTIEFRLSNTDVKNKHLRIPKRFEHLFPQKYTCKENHNEAGDKIFKLIDGKDEYKTHIENGNRLPHITDIFHNHPELKPRDKVYIDILEPKKLYNFRTG